MSPSSCISVVRIGFASTGTVAGVDAVDEVLQRALRDHFHHEENMANGVATAAVPTTSCCDYLTISNRYFTARVALEPIKKREHQQRSSDSSKATTTELNQQEDGVLLLFWEEVKSTHSMSLFDELSSLHDQAERDYKCGDLLRLCVRAHFGNDHNSTNSLSSSSLLSPKQQEEEYARRILWCLDRGYEYVEADLSEEGLKQGHDLRDKDGFARIVEAISGTVWSSAVMNSSTKSQLQSSYQEATDELTETSQGSDQENIETSSELPSTSIPTTAVELNSQSPALPPSTTLVATSHEPPSHEISTVDEDVKPICLSSLADELKEADERAQKFLQDSITQGDDELNVPTTARDMFASAAVGTTTTTTSTTVSTKIPPADEEQEVLLQNFELALREATRIRELSKGGSLTDDERRQRAGDAANLLMSMLGQMGFDDGDDDDDEEEEPDQS